jgi:hypothetical protein
VPSKRSTSAQCRISASINTYWSAYQRTPKRDTVKEVEHKKVTIRKKGKTRTINKTVTKLLDEDFTWKDVKAAERASMSLKDYVIGGMDPSFKLKLYHALRALEEAGLEPGITSAFRDDYRQSLAKGLKAASDRSYHGGSAHGGYGHGLAADVVSVRGATRAERCASSDLLWKWIDAQGKEFGVGRPYLDRDPPHVGPIDGKEYAAHQHKDTGKHAALERARLGETRKDRKAIKGETHQPASSRLAQLVGSTLAREHSVSISAGRSVITHPRRHEPKAYVPASQLPNPQRSIELPQRAGTMLGLHLCRVRPDCCERATIDHSAAPPSATITCAGGFDRRASKTT